jgi:alkanesulfonate monooxygenase SsuD/methylene tetrahydromethanopterin reductase-like flavin-dependent oxidoreductase (luciferase family)
MKAYVDDIKQRGKRYGRAPKVFFSIQPVIGDTTAIAKEREKELLALGNTPAYLKGGLAFASMSLGIDLSQFDLDVPVLEQLHKAPKTEKGESIRFQYFQARPGTTPRDMGVKEAIKVTIPVVGSADEVAERLIEIAAETGADGFAIREAFLPSYINDWVDRVVPALQRRGMLRREYSGKMFRDHLGEY